MIRHRYIDLFCVLAMVLALALTGLLFFGEQLGIRPSSAVPEGLLARANELVCSLGLNPVFYPSCRYSGRDGYLAATDAQRAQDIMHAFENPAIDGVWCARGGYGAQRLLPPGGQTGE